MLIPLIPSCAPVNPRNPKLAHLVPKSEGGTGPEHDGSDAAAQMEGDALAEGVARLAVEEGAGPKP
jgi:hypothetical protein